MGMARINGYGNECGTGKGDQGGELWDRVRELTKVLVRAGGECERKKKGEEGQIIENLKGCPKKSESSLEASNISVFLEQSNTSVHFRNLILQLIVKRPEARRATSVIHTLDEET